MDPGSMLLMQFVRERYWLTMQSQNPTKNDEIFFVNDYLINLISQLIISYSKNTGITVSFTEHFCKSAKQNL